MLHVSDLKKLNSFDCSQIHLW